MSTLSLPFTAGLVAGFKAIAPFASKDATSPAICAVEVSQRYLIATDRYAIGRYEHTTYEESVERHGEEGPTHPDATIYLPREAVEWIGKQRPTGRQTLVITPASATIRWENDPDSIVAVQAFVRYDYSFPAVARLITDASADLVETSPFGIGVDRLAQLVTAGKALVKSAGKNAPWYFQFPADSVARKSSPIRATYGDRLLAMIQPSLKLR